VLNGFVGDWYFKYFRFVLLLASIIPISLRVNLDMAKIYYSYCISNDTELKGCIARNSTIPEELGRIQFLLSDKTGTLTQNDMIFKKLATQYAYYNEDTFPELRTLLGTSLDNGHAPCGDVDTSQGEHPVSPEKTLKKKKGHHEGKKKMMRAPEFLVRDIFLALALCHNVTPTYPDEFDKSLKELQASSPDEVALVKFAEEMGIHLIEREETMIKIGFTDGSESIYDVLANFPFSSETKRMGIILRDRDSQKIVFYLKGAESVMVNKVRPNFRTVVDEACENLAIEGLRTLVIT